MRRITSFVALSILAFMGGAGFVAHAASYSVAIDQGQDSTATTSVELAFTGDADTITISNAANFVGSVTVPFQGTVPWNICKYDSSCGAGLYTVYVKFHNGIQVSDIVSDNIVYAPSPHAGTNPFAVSRFASSLDGISLLVHLVSEGFNALMQKFVATTTGYTDAGRAVAASSVSMPAPPAGNLTPADFFRAVVTGIQG